MMMMMMMYVRGFANVETFLLLFNYESFLCCHSESPVYRHQSCEERRAILFPALETILIEKKKTKKKTGS